ncbi:MAG: adenylyltransferase/cytidyltransferase family protein [Candidatus Vogelbacteria bacterium]|nr:adenylyltransferase/cytidyltransferase family protein [Candidatus Vogelbacteria bacterium]
MSTVNKVILDYRELKKRVLAHKTLGHKVICTIGSWDMLHIGHLRYLNRARGLGDVLIVGTDSDRGIKTYKGPLRPIIPQEERMEMLTYQDCVTYVTLVDDINKKGEWNYKLIKSIPIDAFVAVEGNSYTKKQLAEISKHCELIAGSRQFEEK